MDNVKGNRKPKYIDSNLKLDLSLRCQFCVLFIFPSENKTEIQKSLDCHNEYIHSLDVNSLQPP